MNRAELRAEVFGFLANADNLPLSLIDRALDRGLWSVFKRMKKHHYFQAVREKFIPLVAGEDEVDLGPEVDSVVLVNRMDQGGARCWGLHPKRDVEADRLYDQEPTFSYIPQPNGRIQLLESPVTDAPKGLRLRFRPRPVRLTDDKQVPDVPEAAHESIVVEAVDWLKKKDGVALASPDEIEALRRRLQEELASYLVPSYEDAALEVPDTWGFYDNEGSI